MAIGKTPIPYCSAATRAAYRPDRTFAVGKLGHPGGFKRPRRSAFKICEALSLRRYHLRKRNVKPVLMDWSIIRFPANCLRTFRGVRRPRGSGLRASQGLVSQGLVS